MNAFEVYTEYLALKSHFSSPTYDYHKYQGKVNASPASFEKRPDRYQFMKLAKFKDPSNFLLANFVEGKYTTWIGDLLKTSGQDNYNKWLKRKQALSYTFEQDLSQLGDKFIPNLKVTEHWPPLLQLYAKGKICIETLIIIDDITGCFDIWNSQIADPVAWPNIYMKAMKYKPFMEYDRTKFKDILVKHFQQD